MPNMVKLRSILAIDLDEAVLNIYPDLSKETLERGRALRPLLNQIQSDGATYKWGFPLCLIATKNGRSSNLRFLEDLQAFCNDLNITPMELPG